MSSEADDNQPGSRKSMKDLFFANYLLVQYAYVQFLAEHLVDCRRSLGGDLDDLMLLAVLGQRALSAMGEPGEAVPDPDSRFWMSALRISDVSGVPRETVRRKLLRLEAKGWVESDPASGWRLSRSSVTTEAHKDLMDLDARSIDRLVRMTTALLPLLAGVPSTTADPAARP